MKGLIALLIQYQRSLQSADYRSMEIVFEVLTDHKNYLSQMIEKFQKIDPKEPFIASFKSDLRQVEEALEKPWPLHKKYCKACNSTGKYEIRYDNIIKCPYCNSN